ncbi:MULTISPECIES: F0F1 ATP synthase subunit gamma [Bacteroidaceae]|uniref:F0F1 ATP synthase subunit gamma n=1 Tax=Bacteroidaceae TaxID=815 RepID=UPI00033F592A|nr:MULTISPECIES: F0F1 ATP synthase subunit gamma [Bacteroidaceae]MCL1607776.1 F0F1 ATP synthase subunit gamma [Mediterranea sp. ET5]MDM8123882.1 F0F1 ATP synthase subunit gamma [Mediterranea massiliensis]MDM8197249.1 F0F1 ATP synthase subunit gamma [Mediterranea massiliensis]CDD82657.1 aTP synthase gamma chain [Bacteroides sp. CAG:462]
MASLKEIKGRIGSVQSTLKITSAMKLVASTKLRRAQTAIENMLPYDRQLSTILHNFLASGVTVESPFTEERPVERVAVVVVASNSSLCGGFNSNIIRKADSVLADYVHKLGKDRLLVFPVGRKVAQALGKRFDLSEDFKMIGDKPAYKQASELAEHLMNLFLQKEIDRVELIYTHYKSTSTQIVTHETFLPLALNSGSEGEESASAQDYIVEPSPEELVARLLPKTLRMKIYTILLDSNASEHAARTVAMQQATDNANELLQELNLMYNKGRQQAITSELLDIIGGSMN